MSLELGPLRFTGEMDIEQGYERPIYEGLPFNGYITQLYGGAHNGWDAGAPLYTRISHWGNDGKIVRIDTNLNSANGYAAVVEVDVGETIPYWLFYLHMAETPNNNGLPYEVGDAVKRGQMLGRIGLTGKTTGPHTHLGVWQVGLDETVVPAMYRSHHVDPAQYVVETLTPELLPEPTYDDGPIEVSFDEIQTWAEYARWGLFGHRLDTEPYRVNGVDYIALSRPSYLGGVSY